jgi:hypothetical protein
MNQERALQSGFLTVLLVFFGGLIALLVSSDIAQPARILPYITAAIVVPLLAFKLLQALSPTLRTRVLELRDRVGLSEQADLASSLSRQEVLTMAWLGLLVTTVYVLGLVIGMFLSVFAYIAYQEREYVRAAVIAGVIAGVVYVALPVFFNKLLWAGLLLG